MVNRRTFVQAGALAGLSSFGLTNIVDGEAVKQGRKSVIFIFLQGGASHQESFLAKDDSNERARSVTGYQKTKSGFLLGGTFEKLAGVSDKLSIVHNFSHINSSHGAAQHYLATGYNSRNEDEVNHPSIGSIFSYKYGPTNNGGLPAYVGLSKLHADGASFIGSTYNPFSVSAQGKKNLELSLEKERFAQRFYMLEQMDTKFKGLRTAADIDGYKKQGKDMLIGGVREVFEVKNEPESMHKLYGTSSFAQSCLLARRLVENGVRFVTIGSGGWDHHENIKKNWEARGPELDLGLFALITDLSNRGMLDDTLVVVTSEFGRTLLNNGGNSGVPGRDHHARAVPLMFAGGGYAGSVIGESDKDGMGPQTFAYHPIDLLATILMHGGINIKEQVTDLSGRPRYLVEGESKQIL